MDQIKFNIIVKYNNLINFISNKLKINQVKLCDVVIYNDKKNNKLYTCQNYCKNNYCKYHSKLCKIEDSSYHIIYKVNESHLTLAALVEYNQQQQLVSKYNLYNDAYYNIWGENLTKQFKNKITIKNNYIRNFNSIDCLDDIPNTQIPKQSSRCISKITSLDVNKNFDSSDSKNHIPDLYSNTHNYENYSFEKNKVMTEL